jgi:hypothetical protein
MKKILSFFIGVFCVASLMAQPPEGPANKGMTFGQKTTAKGAMSVIDLSMKVDDKKEIPVKVRGRVTDVCTKEGCWLKMQTADGKMMVKMKDHAFLVPVDLNGKEIVVDGTAIMKVTPVKELQHYAEDAGKSKEEIAKITEPKKEIVMNAKGILVL